MAITRNDVAKLAGVSPATVSYVVNKGPRPVADETREKVARAIQQLGYHPSAVARSLRTRRTSTVGIIISDILNPILALIAQSIEDELLQADYSLILCNTKELPERELVYLKMLISKEADGLVILSTGANRAVLFSMVESGKRLVLLDRRIDGLDADSVLFDNENGANLAVRHLISLGHSRIGMINLPPQLTPGADRLHGYERALREAGVPVDRALVKSGSFTAEEAYSLVQELLASNDPPTAIFASSNRLARGVLQLVRQRQLRMPDDLALAVYDDIGYYGYFNPTITAVAHDYRAFGREAARLVMERINQVDCCPPRVLTLPCRLEVRESTRGCGLRPAAPGPPYDSFAESPVPATLDS